MLFPIPVSANLSVHLYETSGRLTPDTKIEKGKVVIPHELQSRYEASEAYRANESVDSKRVGRIREDPEATTT